MFMPGPFFRESCRGDARRASPGSQPATGHCEKLLPAFPWMSGRIWSAPEGDHEGTKRIWLREENLPDTQRPTLEALKATNLKAARAWAVKKPVRASDRQRRGRRDSTAGSWPSSAGRVATGTGNTSKPPPASSAAAWTIIRDWCAWGCPGKTRKDQEKGPTEFLP